VVFLGNPSPFLARCHCFAEGTTEPAAGVQKGAWEMGNGWYVFLAGLFGWVEPWLNQLPDILDQDTAKRQL